MYVFVLFIYSNCYLVPFCDVCYYCSAKTTLCLSAIPFHLLGERPGDRFTKVIVNRKSKITLKISLRAGIRAFH